MRGVHERARETRLLGPAIAQVIINHLDFGMGIQEAITAPRFDSQGGPIATQIRIPASVVDAVRARHPVERTAVGHGGFALVHAIAIDAATGRLTGGADTGSAGMAIGV